MGVTLFWIGLDWFGGEVWIEVVAELRLIEVGARAMDSYDYTCKFTS